MSDEDRLKLLLVKRQTIINQIKSYDEFLKTYRDEQDDYLFQLYFTQIVSLFSGFEKLHDEIEILDPVMNRSTERVAIYTDYFNLMSKVEPKLNVIKARLAKITAINQESAQTMQTQSQNRGSGFSLSEDSVDRSDTTPINHSHSERTISLSNRRKLKLPQATLPTFDGQIEKWISFKGSFTAMIHDASDITNVEKLQYLKSALSGEALDKVDTFPITEENYIKAWDLLMEAYENKRALISRHIRLLLNLPPQEKNNPKSLVYLADQAKQNIQFLETLETPVCAKMMIEIIEGKLLDSTLEKWEEITQGIEAPSLNSLFDFLNRSAARSLKRPSDRSNDKTHYDKNNASHKKRKFEGKTSNQQRQAFVTNLKKCIACNEDQHALYRCSKFRNLPVHDRIRLVKNSSLCNNCLRAHGDKECKFGNCQECDKKHNTLLHIPKKVDTKKDDAAK